MYIYVFCNKNKLLNQKSNKSPQTHVYVCVVGLITSINLCKMAKYVGRSVCGGDSRGVTNDMHALTKCKYEYV